MADALFWLDDTQWDVVSRCLPTKQRGPKRVRDRTVISGIIHVLQTGCPWRDCPPQYGPYTTVFNRFNRWRNRGIWHRIAAALDAEHQLIPADGAKSNARIDAVRTSSHFRSNPASTDMRLRAAGAALASKIAVADQTPILLERPGRAFGPTPSHAHSTADPGDSFTLSPDAIDDRGGASPSGRIQRPPATAEEALAQLVINATMHLFNTDQDDLMAGLVTTVSMLEAIRDKPSLGFALLSAELRYLHVNAFLAELNGIPAAEHIGRTVHDVVPRRPQAIERIMKVLSTGRSSSGLEVCDDVPDAAGVKRIWLEFCYPIRNANGSVGGLLLLVHEFKAMLPTVAWTDLIKTKVHARAPDDV